MNKKLALAVCIVLFGYAGIALAQTVFASLRVNGQSDLRGDIVNGAGNVTVADSLDINSTLPALNLFDTNGTANARRWRSDVTTEWNFSACTDALVCTPFMFATRGLMTPGLAEFWNLSLTDGSGSGHTTVLDVGNGDLFLTSNIATDVLFGAINTNTCNGCTGNISAEVQGQATATLQAYSAATTPAPFTGGVTGAQTALLGTFPITIASGTTRSAVFTAAGVTVPGNLTVNGSCTGCGAAGATGTFTLNLDNGCATTPTIAVNYYTLGSMVHWYFATLTGFPCTSDSTSFRTTGLDVPVAMRPENAVLIPIRFGVEDGGGTDFLGTMLINTTGDVLFGKCTLTTDTGCSSTNWTAAGAGKNIAGGSFSFTYSVNTTP